MRLWVCGLAALLWSCDGGKDDDDDGPDADGDADTDSDTDTDTDTDTDSDADVPGLDERPANPTCLAPDRPVEVGPAKLTRVYPALAFDRAMEMKMAPGDTTRWWVPTQEGILYRFDDDPSVATTETVLNITDRVDDSFNEMGLLGIAFHPDFAVNGELYVYYTGQQGGSINTITRFLYDHVLGTIDPDSESPVWTVDDFATNHNGGTIAFGPDGLLYLGTGDGGNAGDPGDRAQDPLEPFGKMLRFDVDGIDPYEIPADNPFAGGGGLPEIYALGLRNPFRFAFDPDSGDLWLGDVGQGTWEEINLIELGGNYGWNIREGFGCYNGVNCPSEGLLSPVSVYPSNGSSVIAGEVYHGTAISGLQGTFLYNDYYGGDIFGLFWDAVTAEPVPTVVAPVAGVNIVSYAAHPVDHEVYLVAHDPGGQLRGLYTLEPDGAPPKPDPFPTTLSATGCFDATDPTIPLPGLVPYTVSHPFWSDGAEKTRWLAIPDGTTIDIGADGDWEAPIGTVLIKEFSRDGVRLETRLLVRHDDGEWAGYSYAWRADESDADLLYGGLTIDTGPISGPYAIPDRGGCLQCHTGVAGGSLGLETPQFNTDFAYATTGRTANQLVTLDHIGMFTAALPAEPWPVLPAIGDQAYTTEERARAYLHVNCSMCHRPDGPSRTETDFLYTTAMENTGLCEAPARGDLGIENALIISPGDPLASVLPERMNRRDAYAMPPLGTLAIDLYAVGIFHSWIVGMATCP
jgi:uncharacterized repeat protein (TIGR03806 family)